MAALRAGCGIGGARVGLQEKIVGIKASSYYDSRKSDSWGIAHGSFWEFSEQVRLAGIKRQATA